MLYKLGRFLQGVALFVIVPAGIVGNVMEKLDLKQSLLVSAAGIGVFFIGWLLQQTSRHS